MVLFVRFGELFRLFTMDKYYPLKHWGLTLLIAPIPLILNGLLSSSFNWNILDMLKGIIEGVINGLSSYIFIVFASIFFSLPTLLVCLLLFYLLKRINANFILTKVVLITIAILGIIITFQLIKGSAIETLTYIYGAVSLLVGSILNIKKEESTIQAE